MVKDAKMTKRRKADDEERARLDALHILLIIYINTEDTLYVIGM